MRKLSKLEDNKRIKLAQLRVDNPNVASDDVVGSDYKTDNSHSNLKKEDRIPIQVIGNNTKFGLTRSAIMRNRLASQHREKLAKAAQRDLKARRR